MFSRIPQFIALCNPFKVLQKSDVKAMTDQVTGNVYDYESALLGETIVMVTLDASQVALILSGDRHADWICSLQDTLGDMVDSGAISIAQEYVVSGTVTVTSDFEVTVTVDREEDAADAAHDAVSDAGLEIAGDYVTYTNDIDIDIGDVEAA